MRDSLTYNNIDIIHTTLNIWGSTSHVALRTLQGPSLTDEQVLQLCRGVVTAQISQYASSIRTKCSQGCPINNRTLIGPPGVQGPPGNTGKAVSP